MQTRYLPCPGIYTFQYLTTVTEIRFELYMELFKDRLSHVPVRSPEHVLDIRTGTGNWAIQCGESS
jgi:ubiquinone/menaquinone biosynthesis C-methylase UbiE